MGPFAKKAMVVGALCLAWASGPAYAGSTLLETNIPFPFVVSGRTLPAGTYAIERDGDVSGALIIRGEHGNSASAIVNTRPADAASAGSHAALEFRRIDNQYCLSNVVTGEGWGRGVALR
jgi:hypothetical protein